MAGLHLLSDREVKAAKRNGVYGDGSGLFLRVQGGTKSWVYIWKRAGQRRERGLGAYPTVGLADARKAAQKAREAVAAGVDPRDVLKPKTEAPTFGELADQWVEAQTATVKSDKSVTRWQRVLGGPTHPHPYAKILRKMKPAEITTEHVLTVLKPIQRLTGTAPLARGYIERVMDSARAAGHITGAWENPARWRGHLEHLLPKPQKNVNGHHKAMPYVEAPAFMAALRSRVARQNGLERVVGHALELTVLCALRTDSTIGARRKEIDLVAETWTIPAERMKGKKNNHRDQVVPLAGRALEIAHDLCEGKEPEDFLFPGMKTARPISNMAMEMLMRRMGFGDTTKRAKDGTKVVTLGKFPDYTVHGFRSSFKDWALDQTEFADEVSEEILGHVVGSSARRAYRRGTAIAKARELLKAWDAYCAGPTRSVAEQPSDQEVARQL